ncbi:MATE family efflux transporter [Planctomicrobium sp. SH661]|uniref:MATE family efflux transporter n=1 Tax=Planctomicrobium sp. SH661 TaxID=3448124 RepID=UPI003F5BE2F2
MDVVKSEIPETAQASAPAGSLRELLHVAFPLVISAGSLSLMNVVDRIFIARLSLDALAASMPAVMLNWTIISLPFGIAGYTNAFVSQYEGAGRKDRVASAVWQGILIAVLAGLVLQPLVLFSKQIFGSMGHEPHVAELEAIYFNTLCPVALPILLNCVLSAFFTARKRSAVVMWVNLAMSVMNACLAPLLIFGWGSVKPWGISGAAASTVLAEVSGTLMFICFMIPEARKHGYPFAATFRADWELFRRNLRYGLPNGVQMLLDVGAFTLFIALIGKLGTNDQAATNLAFTLNSVAFIPMMGMGTAVMTLVGHRVGEKQPHLAAQTVWKAFALSGGYMLVFAMIYLSVPRLILSPFMHGDEQQSFETIEPIVVGLLKFVALYTFFDAMAIIFGSAVRGAGDTLFSLIFSMISAWLLMVVPTVLIIRWGGDLYDCWAAITATVIVMGIGFLARFLQGKWKSMRVIEIDPLEGLP